jgi:UPF0716 protein FxsA
MAAFILLFLFIGLPIAEILTFIEVGGRIGGLATIGATIATAAIGALLFRIQGMSTLARAQTSLRNGTMPLEEVVSGLGLLLGAICLFVPGFVTDAVGFLLFIPAVRLVILGTMLRPLLQKAEVRMSANNFGSNGGSGPNTGGGTTIDADFQEVPDGDLARPTLTDDTKPGDTTKDDDKP